MLGMARQALRKNAQGERSPQDFETERLGSVRRVLGVLHRVVGVLHRVAGVLHRVLRYYAGLGIRRAVRIRPGVECGWDERGGAADAGQNWGMARANG